LDAQFRVAGREEKGWAYSSPAKGPKKTWRRAAAAVVQSSPRERASHAGETGEEEGFQEKVRTGCFFLEIHMGLKADLVAVLV